MRIRKSSGYELKRESNVEGYVPMIKINPERSWGARAGR
jgi:hypothetical protein